MHHGARRPGHLRFVPQETGQSTIHAADWFRRRRARRPTALWPRHTRAVLLSPWPEPALSARLLPRRHGVEAKLAGGGMNQPGEDAN